MRAERRRMVEQADARLAEAHHRIGNHLQILVSLIGRQAREHPEPLVREALWQVRRRILAVARIHVMLQHLADDEMIDIAAFLARLAEDLRSTFGGDESASAQIDFDVETAEIQSETAVTLALIINELVTNSMKHGVSPTGGEIKVSLKHQVDGYWRLTVADNGPGLPDAALETGSGQGLGLVRILAQRIKGTVSVGGPEGGGVVSVSFI